MCICAYFQCLTNICVNNTVVHKIFRLITLAGISCTVLPRRSLPPFIFSVWTILYNLHCFSWYGAWVAAGFQCLFNKIKTNIWLINVSLVSQFKRKTNMGDVKCKSIFFLSNLKFDFIKKLLSNINFYVYMCMLSNKRWSKITNFMINRLFHNN